MFNYKINPAKNYTAERGITVSNMAPFNNSKAGFLVMEKEIWKPIINYERFYEISNLGRVRSIDRAIKYSDGRVYSYAGKIKKQSDDGKGYMIVGLWINSKGKLHYIHRLVYQAFIGELVNELHIDHIDNNKLNNHYSNLQQITHRHNNTKDKQNSNGHTGVFKQGEKFAAYVGVKQKKIYLGTFNTAKEAGMAYKACILDIN